MTMASLSGWLRHPMAEALLRFNLVPSLLLHPGRDTDAPPAELKSLPGLHRHRSAALLKRHGLDPVLDFEDPALPIAMLPQAHFERLLLLTGAALNAPHIRRTIARSEISELKARLGTEGMAAARTSTAATLSGLPVAPDWEPARADVLCMAWGAAIVAQAFDAATPPVGRRGRLRLAPEADVLRTPLAAAGLQPERALRVARELLQSLEPAWLSSFPATR